MEMNNVVNRHGRVDDGNKRDSSATRRYRGFRRRVGRSLTTAVAVSAAAAVAFLAVVFLPPCSSQTYNEALATELLEKMESDAAELAREIERLYLDRCEGFSLDECALGNYDHCLSSFDQPVCMGGDNYQTSQCGDGNPCSGLYDFSATAVRVPSDLATGPDDNPTDPQVIETICFTRELDGWFQAKRERDADSWEKFGTQPRSMYFGSHNAAFRIYPARKSEQCGAYDPRVRPWYVAASSGPKNVVMVLDTSGSMQGLPMDRMKEAAKRVVSTLTVGDRVAIIPFNSYAESPLVDDRGFMYTATAENKEALTARIDDLQPGGKTNFEDAFRQAFDVLQVSIDNEFTVNCNSAILFLTDGVMTNPPEATNEGVIEYVNLRLDETSNMLGKPIVLFTYSISADQNVDVFPSELACSTEYGIWSKIEGDDEIVHSLTSYYHLFALGLGSDSNEDFAAWVEPYEFSTGNILGTTVSVPVYDRTKDPHLFLGVAAVDIALTALQNALGAEGEEGVNEAIDRVVVRSTAVCPALNLTLCEMESVRRQGAAGNDALCTNSCGEADFVVTEEQKCPAVDDYPKDLWINKNDAGRSFEDAACCKVGETTTSDECPAGSGDDDSGISSGVVAGIVVAVVVALAVAGGVVYYSSRGGGGGGGGGAEAGKPSTAPTAPVNPNWQPENAAYNATAPPAPTG